MKSVNTVDFIRSRVLNHRQTDKHLKSLLDEKGKVIPLLN